MRAHSMLAPCAFVLALACGSSEPARGPRAVEEPPPVTGPRAPPQAVEGALSVDIHFDARKPRSRTYQVRQEWHGARSPLRFKRHGDDTYVIDNVRLQVDGVDRKIKRDGRVFTPQPPVDGVAVLTYSVRPGGESGLGHQGWLDEEFGVFDGRALLMPLTRQPIARARIGFALPEGWSAATSLLDDGDGWYRYPDELPPAALTERLRRDCHGVGVFDARTEMVRGVPVRSYVHTSLKEGFTSYLHDSTLAMAGWYDTQVGLATPFPRAFVRTPARGKRVFGGFSPGGACFEGRAPDKSIRNAQLLARRMADPLSAGIGSLRPATAADRWFVAGLRHYFDLVATESSGALERGLLGPELWMEHQAQTAERPKWSTVPLGDELRLDSPTGEHIRTVRGPLALHVLSSLIRQRTDTTLEAFVAHLMASQPGTVHVQADLERFTGASFDDFFRAYVDEGLPMAPMVPGLITDWARDRSTRPMVATTASYPVPVDYLVHLARSGEFDRYEQLLEHVGREGPRRKALADRGVRLLAGEALATLGGIDPRTRVDLVQAESQWPGRDATTRPSQLALTDHPAAEQLRQLVDAEAAYDASLKRSGVERIGVRPGPKADADRKPEVLVVHPDEPFTIYIRYHAPLPALAVEVWRGDTKHFGVPVVMEPGWERNRLEVGVADRPATPGLLTIRVVTPNGEVWAERSVWQHSPS